LNRTLGHRAVQQQPTRILPSSDLFSVDAFDNVAWGKSRLSRAAVWCYIADHGLDSRHSGHKRYPVDQYGQAKIRDRTCRDDHKAAID
jgi:hypothetical protein